MSGGAPRGDAERLHKALGAIRTLRSRVEELERGRSGEIAIVGMACRFPGAPDPAAYWRLLRGGESGVREVPQDRWDLASVYDPTRGAPGKMYCREGGFLDDVTGFDAAFFGISPREARRLDPQQRLLLEVTWEALESAGIDPRSLEGSATGVFVGISESEFLQLALRRRTGADMIGVTGTSNSVASGRLSYHLGLRGPNLAVDTACSSSLVAAHLAIGSLRRGESDLALAGGVSLMLTPDITIAFCSAGALASDGRCKTFDASADGYGRGEGCGMVVLKRLADAVAAGDQILAVIRGSAVNQDGRTNGLTAPSGPAQEEVIRRALEDAGLSPAEVAYVETHGTGTELGDPIEVQALGSVFGERSAPLVLGAAKSNIGHLEAAAGVAGLIKTVLVLQHGEIPPNLGFHEPNPHIPWAELPVTVPTGLRPWPEELRAAGVSSFGFSGTNAHLVLERPLRSQEPRPEDEGPDRPLHLLTLSARTPEALRELADRQADALAGEPAPPFADACHTLNVGRARFTHRLGVVAGSSAEAATALSAYAAGDRPPPSLAAGRAGRRPRVAFLFTGQGAQYAGMGRQLYETHPGFRRTIDRCDAFLRDGIPGEGPLLETPLLEALYPAPGGDGEALIDRTAYAQPALFAVEVALAELWRSWGVEPAVVLGHSTGEYAAACVAGVFRLEDGLALIARRARLIESATGGGATAAVFAGAEAVAEVLTPFAAEVGIAGTNGPRETLIAGAAEAVAAAREALRAQGMDGRPLKIPHAPHSPLIEPVLDELEAFARGLDLRPPRIKLLSNVTGEPAERLDAVYWRRHVREPVRFAEGMETLAGEGCDVMLELGPQPVLQLLGRQSWSGPEVRWLSSLWAQHDDWKQILGCARDLFVAGVDLDWVELDRGYGRRKLTLPTYPFQRSRYWLDPPDDEKGDAVPEPTAPPDVARAFSDSDPPGRVAAVPDAAPGAASRRARLEDELRQRLADYLELPPAEVEAEAGFVEMGADSLLLARVVQDVEDLFGVSVGIGRLFEDLDSLDALAGHLDRKLPAGWTAERRSTATGAAAAGADAWSAAELALSATPAASPSPAGALAAAGAIPNDGTLAEVVARQLEIQARQLELLAGAAAASVGPAGRTSAGPATAASPRPARVPAPPMPEPRDLTPEQRRHLDELVAEHTVRTAASRERAVRHRPRRVDSRVRSVRPETLRLSYPIVGERAEGSRFWDLDGNEYVDVAMGIGALLCGHSPAFIADALAEQMGRGLQTGPVADLGDEVAERICEMTGMERVLFGVTGTGAVRGALRIAQAATGRSRIALFSGSYHGQDDRVMALPDAQGDPLLSVPMVPGVPARAVEETVVLPYGDARALEIVERHAGTLAAVLVEPVQSRNPDLQPQQFLVDLRQLTSRLGVPLIFDEVITGFRVHPRGVQGLFGVQADIATYGKCLGGGLPASVIAGKAELLDHVDGGAWFGAPGRAPEIETTFIGSTFEMHPLALASTRAVLRHLEREGPGLQEGLNRRTAELAERLDALFAAEEVPIRVARFASLFRFAWKGNTSYAYQPLEIEIFHYHLIQRGIYLWEGRTCFLSTAHTRADLDAVVRAVEEALAAMRAGGFLPARRSTGSARVETAVAGRPSSAQAEPGLVLASVEQEVLRRIARDDGPEAPSWCVPEHLRLRGPFDVDACLRALRRLVERHEALRTRVEAAGEGRDGAVQRVLPAAEVEVALGIVDLTAVAEEARDDAVAGWWREEMARPFDLARGPLLRAFVLELDEELHHLCLLTHHVVCDGWSIGIVLEELAALYSLERRGSDVATLGPCLQMRDFVERENERLASVETEAHRAYWRERLSGGFPELELPVDRPGTGEPGHPGDRVSMGLDEELRRGVEALGRAHRCTLFMTLLAAHGLMIHRLAGRDEVVIGVPVANRSFKGSETIVGYCTHFVPVASRVAPGMTLPEYLEALRATLLAAYEHQELPFAELCAAVDPRAADPVPLATVFNLDRAVTAPELDGLESELRAVPARYALVDFRLDLIEHEGGLWLDCDYRSDRIDRTTAGVWCSYFRTLLEAMVADPEQALDRLPEAPERQGRAGDRTAPVSAS